MCLIWVVRFKNKGTNSKSCLREEWNEKNKCRSRNSCSSSSNFKNPLCPGTNYKILERLAFLVLQPVPLARALLLKKKRKKKKCFIICNKSVALDSINLPTQSVLVEFLTQTSICSISTGGKTGWACRAGFFVHKDFLLFPALTTIVSS